MKVKELFESFTSNLDEFTVYIHDTTTNTVYENALASIQADNKIHDEWKNAVVLAWSITGTEFILTVEKEAANHVGQ